MTTPAGHIYFLSDLWTPQGPAPIENAPSVNNWSGGEGVGAIHTVLADPRNADILYVGAVNGGVWRTRNATAAHPIWEPLTDNLALPANSITAMEFDPTDPTYQTVIVGIGRASAFASSSGGPANGLLVTTDGGNHFTQLTDPLLLGQDITGVAKRGNLLLASAEPLRSAGGYPPGLFRSVDNGKTWNLLPSEKFGLPAGFSYGAYDLVGDPTNPKRFYASVAEASWPCDGVGIFCSDDAGETWRNISLNDPTGLTPAIYKHPTINAKMAVFPNGRLYIALIEGGTGNLNYIGFTDNRGGKWTSLDLPELYTNPASHQGYIQLAMQPDLMNQNIVYAGGDTGGIYRGDTTAPKGSQWVNITVSTSPHVDHRDMAIDARGNLIDVDDGGIYRRTNPKGSTGDWFSINGNLQITEIHSIAYDTVSNTIIAGTQDNGTVEQISSGSKTWKDVTGGDGGDVAVDAVSTPGSSIRYVSSQGLGGFKRQAYNAKGEAVGSPHYMNLTPGDGSNPEWGVAPLELNVINPKRLLLGGIDNIYESFDQGDNISIAGPGSGLPRKWGRESTTQNAMVYGGWSKGIANPDVIYYGTETKVYLREQAGNPAKATATPFPGGGFVHDIVLDPSEWRTAFVIDNNQVFQTPDAGKTWSDLTGNLIQDFAPNDDPDFRTIEFISAPKQGGALVLGSNRGIFASLGRQGFKNWFKLGVSLPNVPVWDFDYDKTDDVLAAGTIGRGAWLLSDVSKSLNNTILGDASNNSLAGGDEDDTIYGLAGNDTLSGNKGDDHLYGGPGNDRIDGGEGRDTYVFDSPVFDADLGLINLETGAAQKRKTDNTVLETDTLLNFENAVGSPINDRIIGSTGNNQLSGSLGNDTFLGLSGNDTIDGGEGIDVVDYSNPREGLAGADLMLINLETGGAQKRKTDNTMLESDILISIENAVGSTINDRIIGSNSDNQLAGSLGNDTFLGLLGNDTIDGGGGVDTVDYSNSKEGLAGADLVLINLQVGAAQKRKTDNTVLETDTLTNIENAVGSTTKDRIIGSDQDNQLSSGLGNDELLGLNGNDVLNSGAGDDVLLGGLGNDTLTGGGGVDQFKFNFSHEGVDKITDFSVADDTIYVSKYGFGGGLTAGAVIGPAQFTVGFSATSINQRFIYTASNGSLYFDEDGAGGKNQLLIAQLSTGLSMTNKDIFVVA